MLKRIRDLVEECFVKAEKYYGRSFDRPVIQFNLKGRARGQVKVRNGVPHTLRFNIPLARRDEEDFFKMCVPHEVAHYIQYTLNVGRKIMPHGREWKEVMIYVFGLSPRRCHKVDSSGLVRRQNRFTYNCGCMEHHLSATRHNKMMRGKAAYRCTKCGMPLKRSQNVARKALTSEQL